MLYEKIKKIYKNMVYARADDTGAVFYFSRKDFPGLTQTSYPFRSSRGHTLQGYFYAYEGYIPDRVVIFEHGMGSGHRGYMKEIELLARHGYRVFAYDHTGCMESGGETTGGFLQSLSDLDDALTALKQDKDGQGVKFSVVGHSWGGFSTLNILSLHPDVEAIVAMAGFLSLSQILQGFFSGPLAGVGKRILQSETAANPDLAAHSALNALKNTSARALILHSADDKTVSCRKNFDVLKKELDDRPNLRFVRLNGKGHNPNYTADAVRYKDAFFKTYTKMMKKGRLSTDEQKKAFIAAYDWDRMTAQDPAVWEMILETLDR